MEKSQEIGELVLALSRAQGEFRAVPFNAVNPFLKNRYADLGAVIEAAKDILSNHELSVIQTVSSSAAGIGVTTTLAHKSGQWMSDTVYLPLSDEKGKSLAQVAGSVITYLRRYAYAAMLGLYADEDTDGTEPERKPAPQQPQKKPVPQKQEPVKKVEPEKALQEADTILVWDGKTQKPAQEFLSIKAVESFRKLFENTELFKVPQHLTRHLKDHFGAAKIADLTYEKATALAKHIRGEGDDPRWYPSDEKKESPKAESAPLPDAGVDRDVLAEAWFESCGESPKKYSELPDDQKGRIESVLDIVRAGGIEPGDIAGMVDVLMAG